MRPGEILDAIGDMRTRLETPDFQDNIRYLAAHHLGKGIVGKDESEQEALRRRYEKVPNLLDLHCRIGAAYRVTHDMSKMVEWMSTQLDGTDQIMRQLAPTEAGVVCFDRPLRIKDIRGMDMLVHWLIWGPGHFGTNGKNIFENRQNTIEPGTCLWLFNDTWRERDEVQTFLRQEYLDDETMGKTLAERERQWDRVERMHGRWATVGMDIVFDGQRLGPPLWTPDPDQAREVLEEGFTPVQGTNAIRFMHALWLLLGQTITKVEDDPADRPARRRAIKRGMPSQVSVIRLRREESATKDMDHDEATEWSHRWIVRRHWRWQPYGQRACNHEGGHQYGATEVVLHNGARLLSKPCLHCDAHVARITIEAYEKGPEGAPLVITDKLYDLSR